MATEKERRGGGRERQGTSKRKRDNKRRDNNSQLFLLLLLSLLPCIVKKKEKKNLHREKADINDSAVCLYLCKDTYTTKPIGEREKKILLIPFSISFLFIYYQNYYHILELLATFLLFLSYIF